MERLISYLNLVVAYTFSEEHTRRPSKELPRSRRGFNGPTGPVVRALHPRDQETLGEAAIVYLARRVAP
jgi:hypothetical protein